MSVSGWSVKEFHRKAWHVTKTYKQLWLLGLAVMVFAGGGSNSNIGDSFNNSNEFDSDQQVEAQVKTPMQNTDDTVFRLDDALEAQESDVSFTNIEEEMTESETVDTVQPFLDFATQALSKTAPVAGLMAILSVIGYIVIGVMIYVVGHGWSKAALILGVADAVEDKNPDISKASVRGLHYVKTVFLVGLIPWIFFVLAILGGVILAAIVVGIAQNGVVGVIVGVASFVGVVIGLIMTFSTVELGMREGVLHSTGTRKAISRGWEITKKFWGKSFWLFLRNGIIELAILLALFIPGIIALIDPVIKLESLSATPNWQDFAPGVVLLFVAMIAYFFFKTVYNVFTFTTWHLAHSVLRKATPSLQRA
jgi:hypothetical protein